MKEKLKVCFVTAKNVKKTEDQLNRSHFTQC